MPSETHQVNVTNYLGFNLIKMIVKTNYHNHLSLNYDLKLSMPKNILSSKSLTHMSIYRLVEKNLHTSFVQERHSFGNSLQLSLPAAENKSFSTFLGCACFDITFIIL